MRTTQPDIEFFGEQHRFVTPRASLAARWFDSATILIVGILMALGVVMVYSASVSVETAPLQWDSLFRSPLKQGVFAVAGFVAMLAAAHADYRSFAWTRDRVPWFVVLLWTLTLTLLVVMLLAGRDVLGARRALVIPGVGVGFQPAELAKLTLVISLASWLTRSNRLARAVQRYPVGHEHLPADAIPPHDVRIFRTGFVPAVTLALALIGLTAIEDFGTAALMGAVMFLMLICAGARWSHLAALCSLGAAGAAALIYVEPYRMERITTFFSTEADTSNAGYQVHQALLAIGSGGWWGRGLGAGVQKYGYLPFDNNDFILAIVCEELGIVGGIAVIALFLALLYRGYHIANHAPDRFGRLLALGLTLTICLQAAFNVGVVTNSLPTKGISLPFVSAGGSGVVLLGITAGLLAAVGRHPTSRRHPHPDERGRF